MSRMAAISIVALLAAGLVMGGCNNQTQKELTALKHQYNGLQQTNTGLKNDLDAATATNADLLAQLDNKDMELATARTGLAALKAQKPNEKKSSLPPGWQETATGAKITLASDILFAAGKAALSSQGRRRIGQIATTIKASYSGSVVRVYGFTDGDPIVKSAKLWKDNLDLSSNRAMAVVRALRKSGVRAANLEAIGMGATHFLAPNTNTAGKAKNRRVEIVVAR